MKPGPAANPAMLDMFRDRDRYPLRDMVPWAGEFAGKYLTSSVQILRLTGESDLRRHLGRFASELASLQAEDGYLGPWPRAFRLTGKAPNRRGMRTWDAWGHYHAMLGLLLWHEESGSGQALECARGIGDLVCGKFLGRKGRGRRLVDTGSSEMNLAVIHSLCLLYRKIPEQRYLDMALQIAGEFGAKGPDGPAGDYLRTALAGEEFYATPKPRWESLHPIMGMAELYWLTGEVDYRTAFEHIWWSIVKLDRHNNGGFTSGEKAQGNPYHRAAIETCCTVAWLAMSVEMLRMTGSSVVADEIELATLNSGFGLHSRSGRWVTYNTPMDGVRNASAHDIVFQARAGSPELNCCSVNGPRALGMIGDWALMRERGGLVLNWYGPGSMTVRARRHFRGFEAGDGVPATGLGAAAGQSRKGGGVRPQAAHPPLVEADLAARQRRAGCRRSRLLRRGPPHLEAGGPGRPRPRLLPPFLARREAVPRQDLPVPGTGPADIRPPPQQPRPGRAARARRGRGAPGAGRNRRAGPGRRCRHERGRGR